MQLRFVIIYYIEKSNYVNIKCLVKQIIGILKTYFVVGKKSSVFHQIYFSFFVKSFIRIRLNIC
jgi:hypothetical protein